VAKFEPVAEGEVLEIIRQALFCRLLTHKAKQEAEMFETG
jgi:hypothetical protein